jgi:hypothetical protein
MGAMESPSDMPTSMPRPRLAFILVTIFLDMAGFGMVAPLLPLYVQRNAGGALLAGLMRYPNGCIEQTTSTAYPLVVLKDLLPAIGVQVSEADLKKFSESGVARILFFQANGGGLSYWPGGTQPHAFATAFGLTALLEAKNRGYGGYSFDSPFRRCFQTGPLLLRIGGATRAPGPVVR